MHTQATNRAISRNEMPLELTTTAPMHNGIVFDCPQNHRRAVKENIDKIIEIFSSGKSKTKKNIFQSGQLCGGAMSNLLHRSTQCEMSFKFKFTLTRLRNIYRTEKCLKREEQKWHLADVSSERIISIVYI